MDIQFWVWLIVIVITLIARSNKKKPQSFNPEQNQPPADFPEETKPVTFEDLLKEIQAAKTPKPKPATISSLPQPKSRESEVEDYDDNLEEETKSLETTKSFYADDKIYETYENAKKAAFYRASLEETLKVEDTEVKFGQFKEFKKPAESRLASEYASELRNPKSFKRALILSEILNRRF